MEIKRCFTSIFVALVLLMLPACTPTEAPITGRPRIYVESLEENWERIEVQALTWHSDAYLTGVILPIIVDYPRSGQALLHAYYFSVADNRKMLKVTINENGEVSTEVSKLTEPLDDPPILREDWRIDSLNALMLLLNDLDTNALITNPDTQCSSLTLKKRQSTMEQTTVWQVLVHDCGVSGYLRNGYIDASNIEQIK